jgi:hypothetical protein
MRSPIGRRVSICVITLATTLTATPAAAQSVTVKVAFWNVRAGKGAVALAGHPAPFVDTTNCTDLTQPLNAWGVGAVQAELAKLNADPAVVALGVTESWYNVCGSPDNIRKALGWTAMTNEQNGVTLIARYGLAGPAQWQQLDTSLNTTPADTMWVARAPVCLNSTCTDIMPVYVAHWYGTGANAAAVYAKQAQQTAAYITATSNGLPHVLVGDLNVWEGTATVCSQTPVNGALGYLRSAGYFDAWLTINGGAEGYTGMINRAGCGSPVGYAWKRIDYAWTPASFQPLDIRRFAVVTPGDASPSDHYGIVVTLPYPGTSPAPAPAPTPAPAPSPAPAAGDIVLYAKNATVVQGAWSLISDTTAAGGARMANPDLGAAKPAVAAAAPASYFELPFTAQAGVAYRLWIRGKAQGDSWLNDSTFVQFSGSLDTSGAPVYRIGTTSAAVVSIEEGSGAGVSGWGWQETGYGYGVYGPLITFNQAQQTLRIQVREDGLSIDQIVLSPAQYLTTAPGLAKNDSTILPATSTSTPAPAPSAVAWTNLVKATASGSQLTKASGCSTCSDAGGVTQQVISADGSMTFSVTGGKRLVVGLGRDPSSNTGYAIDYAFSFSDTGVFEIREGGVYKTEGTFSGSDVFRLTVTAGVVRYYRNDVLVYTSRTPVTGPLIGDTSLQSLGASVTVLSLQ